MEYATHRTIELQLTDAQLCVLRAAVQLYHDQAAQNAEFARAKAWAHTGILHAVYDDNATLAGELADTAQAIDRAIDTAWDAASAVPRLLAAGE